LLHRHVGARQSMFSCQASSQHSLTWLAWISGDDAPCCWSPHGVCQPKPLLVPRPPCAAHPPPPPPPLQSAPPPPTPSDGAESAEGGSIAPEGDGSCTPSLPNAQRVCQVCGFWVCRILQEHLELCDDDSLPWQAEWHASWHQVWMRGPRLRAEQQASYSDVQRVMPICCLLHANAQLWPD